MGKKHWVDRWEDEQDEREPRKPPKPKNPLAKFKLSVLIREVIRRLRKLDPDT